MKTVFHAADSRGHANHGWLDTHHTFSFAGYHNPQRMHFGMLRVLNDDWVAGGMGFGTHPHRDMEIVSIPLQGALEHQDSMGNRSRVMAGDIQVMSAGTGIQHSEFNPDPENELRFLQIWVFPRERGVVPRYDQIRLDPEQLHNRFEQILSPDPADAGVWIHQDAWFHLGHFDQETIQRIELHKPDSGLYIFVLEGGLQLGDTSLQNRDGLGCWDTDGLEMNIQANSRVLLMEVPMR